MLFITPSLNFQLSGKSFFVLFILLTFCYQGYTQGDLLIYPKRLSFEGTQNRVQIINLNNKGKDSATYKLSFLENRMHQDGKFEIIEQPDEGQLFASPYLRFYPRTITLAPNETQIIKVQLIKTNELNDGEYRSHLYFRPEPILTPLQKNKDVNVNTEGVTLDLKPVYGISIATIIRIGNLEAGIELSNLAFEKFNDSIPIITMDFNRVGNASSYGDIAVYHTSPEGIKTLVGEMNGFAVYTPGKLRSARMKLKQDAVDYQKGKLTVSYIIPDSNNTLYAESDLLL